MTPLKDCPDSPVPSRLACGQDDCAGKPARQSMHNHAGSQDIERIERRVLRSLCCGIVSLAERPGALLDLSRYRWTNPEHRVVFEALTKIPAGENAVLRELLPGQATRMGFPDVDWVGYFESDSKSDGEFGHLVRELFKIPPPGL